jgi:hypothetical protein
MPRTKAQTDEMRATASKIKQQLDVMTQSQAIMKSIVGNIGLCFGGVLPSLILKTLLQILLKAKTMNESVENYYADSVVDIATRYEIDDSDMAKEIEAKTGEVTGSATTPSGSNEVNNPVFGVSGGEFRFINQAKNKNGEWDGCDTIDNGKYDKLYRETGCNIAAFGMALDSLGIKAKANDLCKKNGDILKEAKKEDGTPKYDVGRNGHYPNNLSEAPTLAKEYGTEYIPQESIDDALSRYNEYPGKHSAPVIKIDGSYPSEPNHFVVVTGKNPDGTYSVVDPSDQNIKSVRAEDIHGTYQLSKNDQ